MKNTCTVFVSFALLSSVFTFNILGLFPYPGKSHMVVILPFLEELAKKGNNITVLSHYPRNEPLKNYTVISLKGTMPLLLHTVESKELSFLYSRLIHMYLGFSVTFNNAENACSNVYESEALHKVMKLKDKFDFIIYEMFSSDCIIPINEIFNAPVIGFSTSSYLPWSGEKFGITNNPRYIPSLYLGHSNRVSFLERVENVSLLLINTHNSLTFPRLLPPNVIEIGGIHIGHANPSISRKFIEESTDGVIYFSLGSMIKGHSFPQEKREEFLRAFARLPQRVLWKWENETMSGKPDNVMIQKWMPQFDILCDSFLRNIYRI